MAPPPAAAPGPRPAPHDRPLKRLEYALKRLVLRALSSSGRPRRTPPPAGPPALGPHSRVLAIRLNNIGDALVSTPLLDAVHRHTGARLELLCSPRNRVALAQHPAVAAVHVLPRGLRARWGLLRRLARARYDLVLDLHDDVSTTAALAVALVPAPHKLSLAHGLPELYTAQAPWGDRATEHIMTRLARLAPLLGVPLDPAAQNVVFPVPAAATAAAAQWRQQHLAPTQPLVGINLSAGTRARYWATAHWAAVARAVQQRGAAVVVLAAPADADLAQAVAQQATQPAAQQPALPPLAVFTTTDYARFAAQVFALDLLITPDTAVVHLASAARVPVFGLYVGVSTAGHLWTPFQSPHALYQTAHPDLSQTHHADVIPLLAPFLDRHLLHPHAGAAPSVGPTA